jgi:hypothetical protein
MTTPDKWVVIKIEHEGTTIYKVFASWYGGYLGSDSWQLNSGIKDIEIPLEDTYVDFIGNSGSRYRCQDGCYGTNMYSQGVLNHIIEIAAKHNAVITVMDEQKTNDWLKILE